MTRALATGALARAYRWPYTWFVAVVLLSLGLGEWYPFSDFPMYASLGRRTWYVYVTDGVDRPVGTKAQFGEKTMSLRKVFWTRRNKCERSSAELSAAACDAAAGRDVLEFLLRYGRPAPGAPPVPERLRLWRTVIERHHGRIERRRDLLAEVDVP